MIKFVLHPIFRHKLGILILWPCLRYSVCIDCGHAIIINTRWECCLPCGNHLRPLTIGGLIKIVWSHKPASWASRASRAGPSSAPPINVWRNWPPKLCRSTIGTVRLAKLKRSSAIQRLFSVCAGYSVTKLPTSRCIYENWSEAAIRFWRRPSRLHIWILIGINDTLLTEYSIESIFLHM